MSTVPTTYPNVADCLLHITLFPALIHNITKKEETFLIIIITLYLHYIRDIFRKVYKVL